MTMPDELSVTDSQRLVRIETLLELMVKGDADHEQRIRKLERWVAIATGLASVSVVAAAAQAIQTLTGG